MRTPQRDQVGPERPPAAPEAPRFYSVAQVAEMLGTAPVTLYRAIRAGEFPAVRIRGRLIVPAKAVEAMVDAAVSERAVVDASGWVPEQVVRR
ncbi:MAG: helix-turn-helix domain-containing protein [Pseudonocardiaceae bacterium]|nr:helix-turn-helix domain-containing protein [Pseudonocardiaceae bacterium]